jgi:hypothetical protein
MKGRVGYVEARTLGDKDLLEGGCVWTRWRKRDADNPDLMCTQQRLEIEVAGIVDQNGVTWPQ